MSYLDRKRQADKEAAQEATSSGEEAVGAAAAFSAASQAKAKSDSPKAQTKSAPVSKIVQNLPQTRKLLATAADELEELNKL
ncbi:MAG: hypothetical protein ACPGVU_11590 [Limisphaerales bacterium]